MISTVREIRLKLMRFVLKTKDWIVGQRIIVAYGVAILNGLQNVLVTLRLAPRT